MFRQLPALLALGAFGGLSACATDGYSPFTREAGALVDSGDFGNATMNNQLVQTGRRSYVENLNERFSAEVPSTINFAFNSWALDGAAVAVLRRQASWIQQFPEVRFRVYGHTDLVGSDAYNKRLGLRRAQAAVNFLVAQGISRDRLEAVASFGETQPLVYSQGPERENRRTVTEVTGFVQRHPNILDGKYAAIIYRDYVASAVAPSTLSGGALAGTSAGGE
ncbi:OmpA family protein [Oceanicola sp. S124]|uniref:OmpA family protein n=1 Tax=Oceanicola sp. S124 TaxID=1042378 RepID=UPI0002558936|nr:OmpA family protein [Oceanicola sp. S124]